ncbi:monocarboxylate transporter 12-like [Dermacentor variabilis]|uniref:monocarboxylate transporter 12-like n=1 Tax=Dermacentor variabilis TaxID=34621 RepID=UPI003F5C3A0E
MPGARPLKNDPQFGVDSRWSWINAGFCSWVLFLAMATPRVTGIFFYGVIETFRVSRGEASWSVSLAGTLLVLAGPIAGTLCQRFSCRTVLIGCSSVAGIAASLCYLAENLIFITISFGIVHGSALCGMYVAANVLVAQHFEKRRAMACSLVYTASGLNNVVFPPLMEFLRTTYGVRGAFLLYGAILLNTIPAVIVLRSPPWFTKPTCAPRNAEREADDPGKVTDVANTASSEDVASADVSKNSSSYSQNGSTSKHSASTSMSTEGMSSQACLCEDKSAAKMTQTKKVLAFLRPSPTTKQFLTFSFLVHGLSFAAVFFTAGVFVMIPADLARDRGLKPSDYVYVLQAFSAADVSFRAVVGFAIDSRILSIESSMLLGYVVQGVAYEWLVWAGALPPMIAAAFFMGATCGSRLSLQAPALVQDFGISILPTMMGGVSFCAGASLLLRPLLIGYYRDTLGDYTGLLHSMAALNALFVCLWTAKLIAKRRATMKLKAAENEETSRTDLHQSGSDMKCSGESSAT